MVLQSQQTESSGHAEAAGNLGMSARDQRKGGIPLRLLNTIMVVLAAIIVVFFLLGVQATNKVYGELEKASENYILCESATSEMKAGSNYLTIQVRSFIVTQDEKYLENYFWEADENRRRERAVETLESLQGDNTSSSLKQSLADSTELMNLEFYAMRLVCEAKGYEDAIEAHLADVELSPKDASLSADEKIELATELVFGDEYVDYVTAIEDNVALCKSTLIENIGEMQRENSAALHAMLLRQRVLAILLFVVFVAMVFSVVATVQRPLRAFSNHIQNNESLPMIGASELRELADSYNEMYDETMKSHDVLRRKAEHDHLTGLYNRSVFERLLESHADEDYAIMIVDADYFKEINDSLGHDGGDAMLQKIAGLLHHAFRTTDYPCRIGGDEFAVFMTDMTEDLRYVVEAKAKSVMEGLRDTSDGLPVMTVSIGIAFSEKGLTGEQVLKRADQALYKVKEAGRNDFGFYDGE